MTNQPAKDRHHADAARQAMGNALRDNADLRAELEAMGDQLAAAAERNCAAYMAAADAAEES